MPAAIRRKHFGDGHIRLGPECFEWYDPWVHALSFEVARLNIAVIGGLNWKPSLEERRWLEAAVIKEGLFMAMERVIKGPDGRPARDALGNVRVRLVMMAMPSLNRNLVSFSREAKFSFAAE